MKFRVMGWGLAAFVVAFAQSPSADDLPALLDARDWTGLQRALDRAKGPFPRYRTALALAFNQDLGRSEATLRGEIRAARHSPEALDAYEQLLHLYLRTGQYRRLTAVMDERSAAFPGKGGDLSSLAAFRGLPDQSIEHFQPSSVPHESNNIEIPLSVNGHAVTYFVDTGAWVSAVSESEAKLLGLAMNGPASVARTMTADASFRMAVAKDVRIGSMRFRNVSFAVFPDARKPFTDRASGRKGIVGVPLILAFRTLRWAKEGRLEMGQPSGPFDVSKANLYFDDDHIVAVSAFQSRKVLTTLDTGAETTDLFSGFAKQFADLLRASGKEEKKDIEGVGGTATYNAVTIPEVILRIGNVETWLRPARVITNETGAKCCAGNLGMDLLGQARAFRIDFGAMTLNLEN